MTVQEDGLYPGQSKHPTQPLRHPGLDPWDRVSAIGRRPSGLGEAGREELGCHGNLCWHFLFGEAEAYFAGSVGFLNPISWCFFRKGKRAGEGGGKRQAGRETVRGSRWAGDGSQDSRELMEDMSLSHTHAAQFRTEGGRDVTSDPLHRRG